MAVYPNSQYLLSLAELKAFCNITGATYDTILNALIPAVQDAIELYCDRRFMKWQWQDWFHYDRSILLPQYPVNTIYFIGTPVSVVTVTDSANRYTFDIKQENGTNPTITPKLSVIDGYALTATDFAFSTYTTVQALVTAVEAAFPALSCDIATGTYSYASMSTKSLRSGTGRTWYGAIRQDVLYRIDNQTNRTLVIPEDLVVQFNALDYWFEQSLNVVWDAGYTQAQVPQGLKMIAAHIINDMLNITKSGGGILKSETVTNYSYTLFDHAVIYKLISENYAGMLNPYKKLIC